jgi:integrase
MRGADEDLVFANPVSGKPLGRTKLTKRYEDTLKRAGVREVKFHGLRHSFGTTMAGQGVPLRMLMEWMSKPQMTSHDPKPLGKARLA